MTSTLNIGILVFREGLECILVLAAVMAGLTGTRAPFRRPIALGAAAGLAATALTWFAAVRILSDLSESLPALDVQAATGLLAVVVLLVVMNWFFHKVYWTGWISLHTDRKRRLLEATEQTPRLRLRLLLGLAFLGFTSLYREGVEVVLFVQSYRLRLGSAAIRPGVWLGLALTVAVGVVTFVAERKLPYRRMLVVTGVLLGGVLLVMVGEQVQEMQLAHWVPTTTIRAWDGRIPGWAGLWFSVFPTVETLAGQVVAAALVLGSYVWSRARVGRAVTHQPLAVGSRAVAIGGLVTLGLVCPSLVRSAQAQEDPYFVTYSHHLEEPGSLEVSFNPTVIAPRQGQRAAVPSWLEVEYGATGWWTTELYLDGQTTRGEGSLFTGFRWENRFRLLMRQHVVNPVLYVEFEDINGADKILKEVVGFDSWHDLAEPSAESRQEHKREIETKLILSRDVRGWNLAGNVIAEKNLSGEPWEFGYAVGAARPLAFAASPEACTVCRENVTVGLELYGGLGEWREVALTGTSHYAAAVVAWNLPSGVTLRVSPTVGLTSDSVPWLLRVGVSYEFPDFGRHIRGWLR